ncbi:serine/threonine-protein kinase-like protein At1g28390 [Pyrus communis]|uniref:serine/threonine-protein kinase-like protein At1g28390 n=1 Tax=Pyrus communis TaxID=23211 RepID=UPI0035BEE155
MGFLSCNAESAIATCDPYNWDRKRKPRTHKTQHINKPIKIRHFYYDDLVAATNGFAADRFLGKGSHGSVYKAILDDGSLVAAVKKTKTTKPSSSASLHNAENEIEILSRVHHPRLVNLIGFCADGRNDYDTKLLVVEYMPNGSLYDLLHLNSQPPGWTRRVRFCLHVARAVQALHSSNPPVIHRDIKSSNVLIDKDWNARLGDLGLALRGHVEDVRVKCTPPAGTLGYLDPGYLAPGDLSTKSDVFSFGILLLEILSGRNAIDVNYSPPSVVDWAMPIIKRGDFAGILDPRIGPPLDPAVIRRVAVLAAKCVRSSAERRPTMAEVVECLKIVRKRVHAPPIWSRFKRRVNAKRVENKNDRHDHHSGEYEEVVNVKSMRGGSRRKLNGKVSSVLGAECEGEEDAMIGGRVARSKSIGSVNEIKAGGGGNRGRKGAGGGVAVRVAPSVVRLNKSRSTGLLNLRSPRVVRHHKRGFVFEFGGREVDSVELDMSKWVISLDNHNSEKMLEKPLVSI